MDNIIDIIIDLLNSDIKTQRGFKKIYWGDPIRIPSSNLPAITVTPSETSVQLADSGRYEDAYIVNIGLLLDARDFIGGSDTKTETFEDLIQKMEERGTNREVLDDTILSVVQKLEDHTDILDVQNISFNYGFKERVQGELTIEGNCSFTVLNQPYKK